MLFRLTGMSSLADGRGIHVLTFETDDDQHAWLNDAFAARRGQRRRGTRRAGHALLHLHRRLPSRRAGAGRRLNLRVSDGGRG